MKLSINLDIRKQISFLSIRVAKLQGDINLDIIAETFTRDRARTEVIEILSESGLKGEIEIDGERVEIV